jgi:hypothetical protein
MKKIEDLKKEISENLKLMKDKKEMGRKYSSISKKNQYLHQLVMYLETKPNEIYLKSEKDGILKIISTKQSQFAYWSENVCSQDVPVSKRTSLFNKEIGLADLKKRLKTLNYLLS